jgi:hypothetical protein
MLDSLEKEFDVSSSGFDPFWIFRSPLSGDVGVNQRITAPWFSPSLTVNYAGNPVIEDRVVTEVGSYGRQIGWLNEIVIALANNRQVPQETLHQMEKAAVAIDRIKKDVQSSAVDVASKALDSLEREQPEVYKKLLRERAAQVRGD